ncbi:MAG: hypothetical protein V8S84_07400 [Lachnospiraceae bacterium]
MDERRCQLQYVKDMKSYIESKDPNRLMSYVSNSLWQTPKDATALGDMIMANDYMGTWHGNKDPRVEIPRFWNEHKEGKPIVIQNLVSVSLPLPVVIQEGQKSCSRR